jgi:hypothetical protein
MESEERRFIQAGPRDIQPQAQIDAMWVAESIVCLYWALNRVGALPAYDQETGPEIIGGRIGRTPNESAKELVASAQLRPPEAIDGQRELAELWHWRCRTHQLIGQGHNFAGLPDGLTIDEIIRMASARAEKEGFFVPIENDFPVFGKAFRSATEIEFLALKSIAQERHKALNWLCGYAPGNLWSKTPTDT